MGATVNGYKTFLGQSIQRMAANGDFQTGPDIDGQVKKKIIIITFLTMIYSFSEKYLQICGMNGPDNHVKLR
ncbi:MAG: hypothetical protein BA861_08565 [Desulfobacterales bacterium S3730MH5]|nr:MAG: hypothetical protein BA861_08565 [Desulfobacterales bacterium S3730MH5]